MKKILSRVIVVLLVLVVGGGGAAWWVTTSQTKKSVIAAIERINAKPQPDGSRIEIKYSDITTAGFPPSITVRLVDPSVLVTMPVAQAGMPTEEDAPAQTGPADTVHWSFKGHADIITNHLDAAYKLELAGDDTIEFKTREEIATLQGKDSSYNFAVKAKSLQDFLAWENLDLDNQEQVEKFIETIREGSADVGALNYVDAKSNQPAFSHESGHFRFSNRSTKERYDFDFEVTAKNSEVYPAYAKLLKGLSGAPENNPLAAMGMAEMPFSAANAGKQNFDIAMSAYINRGEPDAPGVVRVKAPRFTITNNYYDVNGTFDMDVTEGAAGMDFTFAQDMSLNVKEAGAKDFLKTTEMLFAMAPMMAQGNESFDVEAFRAKVTSALPTVSTLGPIKLAMAMKGNFAPKEPNAATHTKGKIELSNFEFSHDRWGLSAKGNVDNMTAETPSITMDIVCQKCDTLTADAMQTAVASQEAAQLLDPKRASFPLGDELLQAINQLLASIGTKDASGNIAFAITTPAANDIRVNDKPVATVMMEGMTALMPFMQPVLPEGVTPPVAGNAGPESNAPLRDGLPTGLEEPELETPAAN